MNCHLTGSRTTDRTSKEVISNTGHISMHNHPIQPAMRFPVPFITFLLTLTWFSVVCSSLHSAELRLFWDNEPRITGLSYDGAIAIGAFSGLNGGFAVRRDEPYTILRRCRFLVIHDTLLRL